MIFLEKDNIKYKLLSFSELVINLDRLSRFKLPEESYHRVFTSILLQCLISPKYSKKDLDNIDPALISKYVKLIWNSSVKYLFGNTNSNNEVNKVLRLIQKLHFKNIDKNTSILINTNLHISQILEQINANEAPFNIKFLILAAKTFNKENKINKIELEKLRTKHNLKYPLKKLVIVEGITEEILLPVFALKINHNFEKEGIYILGAGGKSKSPALYLKLKNRLKIPIILLFDSDAKEVCDIMQKSLLKKDKTIIIEKGEFEDILSLNLIKRALNKEYETITPLVKDDLHIYNKMCENIEYYYRTRNLGEFKKSKLSRIIAENIKYKTDITQDIKNIITLIAK